MKKYYFIKIKTGFCNNICQSIKKTLALNQTIFEILKILRKSEVKEVKDASFNNSVPYQHVWKQLKNLSVLFVFFK